MNCLEIRDKILDGYDEKTPPDEVVSDHLNSCDKCRSWNESLLEVGAMIRDTESLQLPEGFAHRVALVAREEGKKGWRKALSNLSDIVTTVLLGGIPQKAGTGFLYAGITWGILFAVMAGVTTTFCMYLGQSKFHSEAVLYPTLMSKNALSSFQWMPFIKPLTWSLAQKFFCIGLFSVNILVIFFLMTRALNLRELWEAMKRREKLPGWTVMLTMSGVFCGFLLWSFIALIADITFYEPGSYFWMTGREYYDYMPDCLIYGFNGQMAELVALFNPLYYPHLGWLLSGLAFYLLFTRSAKGIPQLTIHFYGCLGFAAIAYIIQQEGRIFHLGGYLLSLWCGGMLGILDSKELGMEVIAITLCLGFLLGIALFALRFEKSLNFRKFLQARALPAVMAFLAVLIPLFFYVSPTIGKVISIDNEFRNTIRAQRTQDLPCEEHTIMVLTGDPGKDTSRFNASRFFPNHIEYYPFPELVNDTQYTEKKLQILDGPFSIESIGAHNYMIAQSASQWDQKQILEIMTQFLEKSTLSCRSFGGNLGDFLNGRPAGESLEYLDRLSDENVFYVNNGAKACLASAYMKLGYDDKASHLLQEKGKEMTQVKYPLIGSVKGRLMVNGEAEEDLTIRLFTTHAYDDHFIESEDEFLYDIKNKLKDERSFFSTPFESMTPYYITRMLPFITAKTDSTGRFELGNLSTGSYYLVLRFGEKLDKVTQKTGVGIINITNDAPVKDLGTIEVEISRGEAHGK